MTVQTRAFPTTGFEIIPTIHRLEEETLPGYKPEDCYPVKLGEVFESKYQAVAKLGYGGSSIVWLCRDLQENILLTLKICVVGEDASNEVAISNLIKSQEEEHPGKDRLRVILEDFRIAGPFGAHQCLVFAPLGLTYSAFRKLFVREKGILTLILRQTLLMILLALDVLHQIGVVHTDVSPNNILLGVDDATALDEVEKAELENPSPRKVLEDRTIYMSYRMPLTAGAPVLSDFGTACVGELGQKHSVDVMPGEYRAPEVIIWAQWDSKIDLWAIGVMVWDLYEGRHLFQAVKDGQLDDEQHLAEMVSILGPPPKKFMEMSEKCRQYWDAEGNWIAATAIPDQTIQSCARRIEGREREPFLAFVRKLLNWHPEDRATAQELFTDRFLDQAALEGTGASK